MRKRRTWRRIKAKKSQQQREIRIHGSAIDYYKRFRKNKTEIDLAVELYDSIIKVVLACEKKLLDTAELSDSASKDGVVKLKGLDKSFEISVWSEFGEDSRIESSIWVGVKSSIVRFDIKKIENELVERFLKQD